jgi:hypothetical protein
MQTEQTDTHSSLYTQMRDYSGHCFLGIFDIHNISDTVLPFLKHCVYQIYARKWALFNIIFTYTVCLRKYSQYEY